LGLPRQLEVDDKEWVEEEILDPEEVEKEV
jgi:hypothetical protein